MATMEVLLGPQPLVRPVFVPMGLNHTENMDTEDCKIGREKSVESNEGTDYERKDYMEIQYSRSMEMSKSPSSGDESRLQGGNYRAELKRPDLKGIIATNSLNFVVWFLV
uniref:Ovule protein n=1 Tax=Heterorhabditis bacteriophora TaxID=37862 RepID=A0A1I7XJZ3_HETBA